MNQNNTPIHKIIRDKLEYAITEFLMTGTIYFVNRNTMDWNNLGVPAALSTIAHTSEDGREPARICINMLLDIIMKHMPTND